MDYRVGVWGHNDFYSEGVQVFTWGSVCFKYSISLFNPARFRKGRARLTPRARKDFTEVAGHAVNVVIKHQKNKTIWVHGYASPDETTTRAKAVALAARRAKFAAAIVSRASRGRVTVKTVVEGFPIPLPVWPSKYEHRFRSVLLSIGRPMFLAYDGYSKMPSSQVKALQARVHRRHRGILAGKGRLIDGVGLHFPVRHITVSTPKGPLKLRLHSTRYDPDEKYLHQYFKRWLARCTIRKKAGKGKAAAPVKASRRSSPSSRCDRPRR
jgi:hypothetical protein